MLTTPPSPVDIAAHFAWLREFAATGIRLHPRRAPNLPVHVSKMGGLFYWPRAVPWPVCHARDAEDLYDLSRPEKMDELRLFLGHTYELAKHDGLAGGPSQEPIHRWISRQMDEVHELARRGRRGHGQPYLPLLQLRREDFPTLPFPRGTDLFQLLWCPHVHFAGPPDEQPGFLVFWRRQIDIEEPLLLEPPMPDGVELFECRLDSEYITEYPVADSFEAHFRADLDHLLTAVARQPPSSGGMSWQTTGAAFYDEMLSAAPGVKLFGYPRWVTEVATPVCICGRRMAILVTIDVDEAAAIGRWRPVEEAEWQPSHGFSIGERGALFLFHCPICPGPRLQALVQTS